MSQRSLFDQVVEVSRLSRVVAPFTVSRLLTRANVDPRSLTATELGDALPALERGLAVYLDADELAAAVADIRALAGS